MKKGGSVRNPPQVERRRSERPSQAYLQVLAPVLPLQLLLQHWLFAVQLVPGEPQLAQELVFSSQATPEHGGMPATQPRLALHVSAPSQNRPLSQSELLGELLHTPALQVSAVQAMPSLQSASTRHPGVPPPAGTAVVHGDAGPKQVLAAPIGITT